MTIYIVDIEPVETRYTGEWRQHVPELLRNNTAHDVVEVRGTDDIPAATTPGAFLNFGGTNIYKATQIEIVGKLFCDGKVNPGDHFVFTDAWHPGIINLKYMSELLNIKVTIHALWHAGSYDPADFLGRLIGDAKWVRYAEKSFYEAVDHNYFATDFHIDMFILNLFAEEDYELFKDSALLNRKIIRSGWPMEYMVDHLSAFQGFTKKNQIVFPHRISVEKQPDIFKDLAKEMPEYEWIICQEENLTKAEYHAVLANSKIVFSASTQETLGIGCYEGAIVGCWPLVPDRLSYTEMYIDEFKYPSEWTTDWDAYLKHKEQLIQRIHYIMSFYDEDADVFDGLVTHLVDNFFSAGNIIKQLK